MRKILLIVLFVFKLSLSAFSTYYEDKVSQFKSLSKKSDKQIVMLGDSLTDRGCWDELTNRDDVANRGIDGDTTTGVLQRLDFLTNDTKQVFIMIGTNDLLRDKKVNYVFTNYKNIIVSLEKKGIIPIIESVLYVGANTPPKYNQNIRKLNYLLFRYAVKNKIRFVDLNKHLAPHGFLKPIYTNDRLHLNGKGYTIWAKTIKKIMLKR